MNSRENLLRTINRNYPEFVPNGEEVIMISPPIIERPLRAGKDCFGVMWDYNADSMGGTYPLEDNFIISDINYWQEQVVFPDIETLNWSDTLREYNGLDKDNYVISGFCEMGIFERSYLLMGMENALCAYLTDTEKMTELCNAIANYKVNLIQKFCRTMKLDIMWYGDDWGTQSNLFVSPQLWRKTIAPATQKVYNAIKNEGVFINQHSCGFIEPIFSDMCQMGAQMWNPCQPCNNLALLKKKYGDKISFWGGIDSQFVLDNHDTTPEDVANEVKKRIDEMNSPNGGYVAAPSHSVPYDEFKLFAMQQTIKNYRPLV